MPIRPQSIQFHVIGPRARVPSGTKGWSAYLNSDQWDDWGKYCTQFYLTVVDKEGEHREIGQVKIGQRGLKPHGASAKIPRGYRNPNVPATFEQLDNDFFSVGQDEEYYANINDLGDTIREQVLTCLRDVARDSER